MRVTIKDIARMAGVSISTVSRVINDSKPVSEDARRRVLDVLKRTNYPPSVLPPDADGFAAKSLIGVVAPLNSNSVLDEFIGGIRSVSRLHGYDVLVSITDETAEHEAHHIRLLRNIGASGILFIGSPFGRQHSEAVSESGIPCVIAGQRSADPACPSVHVDNVEASYEAVTYLIRCGHRDIAMIRGAGESAVAEERFRGFRNALRDAGLEPRADRVVEADLTIEGGMRAMARIAASGDRPTAVFCATDWLAIGAINHLRDGGVRVPEDTAVFGFDGSYMAAAVRPQLSTVEYSAAEIGMTAARSLFKLIKGGTDVPLHANVTYRLVIRGSTQSV